MKKITIISISILFIVIISTLSINKYAASNKVSSENSLTQFVDAIIAGDMKKVKKLEGKHILNRVTDDKQTPLEYAFQYQNYDIANWLLEKGGQVNPESPLPLFLQLAVSLDDFVQLKENEERREAIKTLLHTAIDKEKSKLFETDERGNTILHIAALKGNVDVIQILLDKGMDPNLANVEGETPLFISVQTGQIETYQLFKKQDKTLLESRNTLGQTLLIEAAIYGQSGIMEEMLKDEKVAIDDQDSLGKTALIYMSEYGNEEGVKTLLKRNANPSLQSNENWTAYEYAKKMGHQGIMELLK